MYSIMSLTFVFTTFFVWALTILSKNTIIAVPYHAQAFLIAFTSDFIQKLVYKYEYGERGTMKVR
jgi:hypothetical protein